jgi:LmbE family N-acetylglucosaminyl deacetylase
MHGQPRSLPHAMAWVASAIVGGTVTRLARDVTDLSARRSCLVLAPHPDDETLACGATLARKVAAGTPVHVVVMSDGASWPPTATPMENVVTRASELRRATRVLGIPDSAVTHHDFAEMQLVMAVDEMTDAVADAVRRTRPQEVYTTSGTDPHTDHAALAMAARRALQGSAIRTLYYPVWQWHAPTSWVEMMRESARPESVRTAGFLDRKRRALAEYRSQIALARAGAPAHTIHPPLLWHFLAGREVFFPGRQA